MIDIMGMRFGKAVVCEDAGRNKRKEKLWICQCDCGNKFTATSYHLRSGHTKSCGCLQREKSALVHTTHGKSHTRLWGIWIGMRSRCNLETHFNYALYGGRGIKVCDEWNDNFENFYKWAINNGYTDNLTLDRIDNDKGYSPDNCYWADNITQGNNRRNNHYITYNNETKTIGEWAKIYTMNHQMLSYRITHLGWDFEKAINTPNRYYRYLETKKGEKECS